MKLRNYKGRGDKRQVTVDLARVKWMTEITRSTHRKQHKNPTVVDTGQNDKSNNDIFTHSPAHKYRVLYKYTFILSVPTVTTTIDSRVSHPTYSRIQSYTRFATTI